MQASFDVLDDLLQSKLLQLSQAVEALETLQRSVQDASKKKSSDTGKKLKKGTKSSKEKKIKKKAPIEEVESGDIEDIGKPMMGTFSENLFQYASTVLQLAIEKRGYALFGIAVAGIYYYGDYASV